jgi:Lon protease-like protein
MSLEEIRGFFRYIGESLFNTNRSEMYLPLFPLKLVAFPDEELNLHIFEPRYKQLLKDIEQERKTFGILTYTDKLSGFGTEVRLEKIYKRYEDGRLDIQTRGTRAFHIKSFDNPMEGKLYAAGEVQFLPDDMRITAALQHEYIFFLKEMFHLLHFSPEINPKELTSYSFSHRVGLTLDEELDLLKLESEKERTEYLIRHFKRMIPVMKAADEAKDKIKQNGHFKHLDPLDF